MARSLVHFLVRALGLLAIPHCVFYRLLTVFADRNTACAWVTQAAATWPGPIGLSMRRCLLKCVLARTGRDISVAYGTIFSKVTAELGDDIYIGAYCTLGDVRIGGDTMIADFVAIPSGKNQHGGGPEDSSVATRAAEFRTVTIGARCWIGAGAVVMADVGDDSIVGAGSVVIRPIPSRVIAAGNPARVISQRSLSDDAP